MIQRTGGQRRGCFVDVASRLKTCSSPSSCVDKELGQSSSSPLAFLLIIAANYQQGYYIACRMSVIWCRISFWRGIKPFLWPRKGACRAKKTVNRGKRDKWEMAPPTFHIIKATSTVLYNSFFPKSVISKQTTRRARRYTSEEKQLLSRKWL